MRQLKIGVSSVRGVVGESLTPEMIVDFASAFGTYCDGGTVIVGRDARHSSVMLHAAVLSSLISAGCHVIDLGICTTPLVSFAIRDLRAAGGIAITGSHNDIRWNALKFLTSDGTLLNAVTTEEVLDIYHASEFSRASWDQLQPVDKDPDIRARYLQHLLAALDVERIRACSFRVALDCSNGTAADVALPLLKALGCTVIPLNEEPGSDFAHPPAPTVKNMRQLASLLRDVPADLGAAINIDGDRVGFVTADGRALSEEYSFPLVAGYWLSRAPGPVVTNLSTSRMIDEVARAYGQPVLRTPIGEGYVVDKALAEHAAIAGEGSGGIVPLPASRTFDAVFSLAVVLEAMAVSGKTLQALAEQLPVRYMRKGTLSCPPDQMYRILEGFRDRYTDNIISDTEGVMVDWGDVWMHIRASNTEPLLRIVVEGDKAQRADALFDELMAQSHQFAFGHALV